MGRKRSMVTTVHPWLLYSITTRWQTDLTSWKIYQAKLKPVNLRTYTCVA